MPTQLLPSPHPPSTDPVPGVELEVLVALGSLQRSERSKQVLVNQHTPVLPASPFLYPIFPHSQLQMQARSSLQKGESRESVSALQAGSNI